MITQLAVCWTIITSKNQRILDADPKTIQKINFTGNQAREANADTTMFFIIKEGKETKLDFSNGTVKKIQIYLPLM